ncbi:DHHA2 domain protein [Solidesulfovibrio fructosivorans JJ]]|uniref:inorganic diphosphatase n=1 Tax=Solidesulfovibrio fructosivorans JJ] TaxID=596151 RepID=E1JQY1_SOLFR|nr:manganese-dependent inorganic pyrophosphatase [Solidesulfovibrio fructosivorans]EFL52982.1 DHHA2 domain protein [Solidesulfovibrio fructosivorans JJ]]
MALYVVGHKNPDTDSIAAAISVADLMNKAKGLDAKPAAQGPLNPESAFVLEKFGVAAPEIVTDAADKQIILVDHSDLAQSLDNLDKGEIIGIYDHHKLGDVTTPNPLEILVKPVGCSCTVVKMMYDCAKVEITKPMAGIMMCAILSDTVMFKSPTCTPEDKAAVEALAKIAGVSDYMSLGVEMFKVKSAVGGTPARDLVFRDYKDFDMGGKKIGIGQLEVVDLSILEPVKADLLAECKKVKAEGRHSVFLLLTDIMKEGSEMLIVSDDPSYVNKAFGVDVKGDSVWLDGVLSRKKQVVPPLQKAFA